MTYRRVIPRDLFNEANLLKCYGQLYLELEKLGLQDCLVHKDEEGYFRVKQWQDDGSLSLQNVILVVRGEQISLYRPLNARSPYPLWAIIVGGDELQVFNADGTLSDEMREFLTKQRN